MNTIKNIMQELSGQLNFSAVVQCDDAMYAIVQGTNWIVKLNIDNMKIEHADVLIGNFDCMSKIYSYQLLNAGTYLIVVFRNCGSIILYDISNREQKEIVYDSEGMTIENAFIHKNKLYLFSFDLASTHISIDLQSFIIKHEEWINREIESLYSSGWNTLCWRMQYSDGIVWSVVSEQPYLLKINLEMESIQLIRVEGDYRLHSMLITNEVIYSTCVDCNDIISFTIAGKEVKLWNSPVSALVKFPYFRLFENDGKIYALSHDLREESVAYLLDNGELRAVDWPKNYVSDASKYLKTGRYHTNIFKHKDNLFLCPERSNYLLEISKIKTICHYIGREQLFGFNLFVNRLLALRTKEILIEQQDGSIKDFIKLIGG